MKQNDDAGKEDRRRFLKHDPAYERFKRFENWLFLLVIVYFGGHLTYYLWRTA